MAVPEPLGGDGQRLDLTGRQDAAGQPESGQLAVVGGVQPQGARTGVAAVPYDGGRAGGCAGRTAERTGARAAAPGGSPMGGSPRLWGVAEGGGMAASIPRSHPRGPPHRVGTGRATGVRAGPGPDRRMRAGTDPARGAGNCAPSHARSAAGAPGAPPQTPFAPEGRSSSSAGLAEGARTGRRRVVRGAGNCAPSDARPAAGAPGGSAPGPRSRLKGRSVLKRADWPRVPARAGAE